MKSSKMMYLDQGNCSSVSYLQQLLPDICRIPSVLALPCLPSVWQSCITLPLVALTPPLDHHQRSTALSAYHFLVRCPVLLRIDLAVVAQHFKSLELYALTLACLLISPSDHERARKLTDAMSFEIKQQLLDLRSNEQTLLGYKMVSDFLERTK